MPREETKDGSDRSDGSKREKLGCVRGNAARGRVQVFVLRLRLECDDDDVNSPAATTRELVSMGGRGQTG